MSSKEQQEIAEALLSETARTTIASGKNSKSSVWNFFGNAPDSSTERIVHAPASFSQASFQDFGAAQQ
jgi:hypothetical protein